MSKKPANDMKHMFQKLKVNQPFALSKAGPAFVAPQTQNEVPQSGAPHLEVPAHIESAQIEKAQTESPQIEPPVTELPQFDLPRDKTTQSKPPQNKVTQPKGAHCEVPRNEAAKNEKPQKELPQNEAPLKEVPQGYFKLSHAVFSEPQLQDLSGDCFKLFLWLSSRAWRYPTSDGSIRASISFMESGAGIPHATVSRSLKTLKEKKLITIVTVDFKKGNIWQISPIAFGNQGDDNPPRKKAAQSEATQIANEGASKGGNESLNSRQPLPQNEGQIRSFKKVRHLKEVPMGNVLVAEEKQEPDLSAEERQLAIDTFENSLGDFEKEALTKDFIFREYPHGYKPPSRIVRRLTASDWYRAQVSPKLAIEASA